MQNIPIKENSIWHVSLRIKKEGKVVPVLACLSSMSFLTSPTDGGECCCFTPRKIVTCTHWIEDWVGARARLGAMENRKTLSKLTFGV
jgi:hypothetical protein